MKARYLAFLSYVGTGFRSSEKLWIKGGRQHPDPESVQGLVEIALLKLKSLCYPSFILSSRTDGGVHALNSTAHFDLERYGPKIYEPEAITNVLNKFFYKSNTSISIRKCIRVPDNFNARRKATCRTYLYRFAILKEGVQFPGHGNMWSNLPIEEWKRCHFLSLENFDIEKLKEGATYFPGYHDFSTFKRFDKANQHKHNRRLLYSIEVRPGTPLVTSCTRNKENYFDYWEVEIKGRAFVHNQIRRMMGTLFSVATGKLPPEEIKVMLQVPSKHSWHSFINNCPPDGLYLCNIEYNPEDLIYNPNNESNQLETKEDLLDCESNE